MRKQPQKTNKQKHTHTHIENTVFHSSSLDYILLDHLLDSLNMSDAVLFTILKVICPKSTA